MDDQMSTSPPDSPKKLPPGELQSLQSAISNAIKELPDGLFVNGADSPPVKKIKYSSNDDDDLMLPDGNEKPVGKISHNAIEKRRRDKMNMYIDELAAMVPMCSVVSRRPDKLTILKMAVRHLKALRYANGGGAKNQLRPTFLTDEELKHLILEAEDGFLFIVSCENTRILYTSNSVNHVLHHSKEDLCELGFLDIIHPCDQELVKEQLLVTESDIPGSDKRSTAADFNMISGSRRSFFCRMRHGKRNPDGPGSETDRKKNQSVYSIVHVTGYLKNWDADTFAISHDIKYNGDESEEEMGDFTCLVAVGRILKVPLKSQKQCNEFNWRLTMDDKFLFVDPRATAILEYLPHELVGQSIYKFYHPSDIAKLTEAHQKVPSTHCEVVYRFRAKSGRWVWLHGYFIGFNNPFSGQLQYIICNNIALHDHNTPDESKKPTANEAEPQQQHHGSPHSKPNINPPPIMAPQQAIPSNHNTEHMQIQPNMARDAMSHNVHNGNVQQGMHQAAINQSPMMQHNNNMIHQEIMKPIQIVPPNLEISNAMPGKVEKVGRLDLQQNNFNAVQHDHNNMIRFQNQRNQAPTSQANPMNNPPSTDANYTSQQLDHGNYTTSPQFMVSPQHARPDQVRPPPHQQHIPDAHAVKDRNAQQVHPAQNQVGLSHMFNNLMVPNPPNNVQHGTTAPPQPVPQQMNISNIPFNGIHTIRTKEQFEQALLYNEKERLMLQEYEQYLNKLSE